MFLSGGTAYQMRIPLTLPGDYFERLELYAPYVQSLFYSYAWSISEAQFLEHQNAWPAIACRVAAQTMLPSLKSVSLGGKGCSSHDLDVALDWICALVLPGTNDMRFA
jgi:hypothetical protein